MSHWELNTGKSNEYYTPKNLFDSLGCKFDLDVAHPLCKTHVPCNRFFTKNALDEIWEGFVWMNAPFGARNGLKPWLDRFIDHSNGIALVPDRTSAPWFRDAARQMDLILFICPKISFEFPLNEKHKSPSTGTALFSLGRKGNKALQRAEKLGVLLTPAFVNL